MTPKNLYQVLQVDPSASPEVIEAAYRRLAKKHHPDVSTDPDAVRIMQEINAAFRVLRDPTERERYDNALRTARNSPSNQSGTGQSRSETQAASATSETEYPRYRAPTPPGFPVHCQKCGTSDATLRLAVFPHVISIILLTFRQAWSGVYCARCASQKMTEAKLLTLLLGWWGIPFGIIYTLGVLFKPSQGDIPAEANGPYLRALGAYFLETGRLADAEDALSASLQFQDDQNVATVYQQVFGRNPYPVRHQGGGRGTGALFGVVTLIGLGILAVAIFGGMGTSSSPTITPSSVLPTNTSVVIPTGWVPFRSEQLHFSGMVPGSHVSEEDPPTGASTARGISFIPKTWTEDSKVISVIAMPLPQTGRSRLPSETELSQAAIDWMNENGATVVSPPTSVKHDSNVAVKMVHQAPLSDSTLQIRTYAAMIAAPGWLYYIEVSGLLEQNSSIEEYFDVFFGSFAPG